MTALRIKLHAKLLDKIYDFVSSELMHNKTYAYRLPPTYAEQARSLANFHENGVFSDEKDSGIGNSSYNFRYRS